MTAAPPPPVEPPADPTVDPAVGPSGETVAAAPLAQTPAPFQAQPEAGGAVVPPSGIPLGPPPVPPEQLFGTSPKRGGRSIPALILVLVVLLGVIVGITVLGGSAGASNLKLVFTPGETRTYGFEVTMRGRTGTLESGSVRADVSVDADVTQTTGAVAKDGSASITYTIRNFHYSIGGRRTLAPAGTGGSFTVRMRPDGYAEALNGSASLGLGEVNPAASFVSPENLVPLFPNHRVKPGQSWAIDESETDPIIGKVTLHADNRFVEEKVLNGNKAAVIQSQIKVPLNVHLNRDQLLKAVGGGDPGGVPAGVTFSMIGPVNVNLTHTIFTSNGALASALADGRMSGTMMFGGIPNAGNVSVVYDLAFSMTMTLRSTGKSA